MPVEPYSDASQCGLFQQTGDLHDVAEPLTPVYKVCEQACPSKAGVHTIFFFLFGYPISTSRNGLVLTKKKFASSMLVCFPQPLSAWYTSYTSVRTLSESPLQTRHSQAALFLARLFEE